MLLYDKPECPFCFKVRIALAEQGRSFEHRPHDAPGVEDERRRLSPTGTVPIVVLDDGYVMTESNVIMEYLADTGAGLLPADPEARATARALAHYSDTRVGQAVREVIFEKRGKPEAEWDRERIAAGAAVWENECLPYLAEALAGQEYFAGAYSLADAALTARFALARAYGLLVPGGFENLQRWYARTSSRPSFAAAAPPVAGGA
ncbi:glutathione S-transferase family protein [Ectothiorhodospiraceae bacterium WFHF3C12]|nr:glutathione S-transferase family protein [Ectothiorhodospiraceae bacterium WFHF3C12]